MEGLYKGNSGEALRFFTKAVKNNFQSEKHGRPIYDTGLYVEIITPGSTESVPEMLVERTFCEEAGLDASGNRQVQSTPYAKRFAAQLEAFRKQSGEYQQDGLPISNWPMVDAGTAQTLKGVGIHTVEQLAGVQDGHLQNLGTGGRHLRDQAKAYITARQFGVPIAQEAAKVSAMQDEIAQLRAQVESLQAALRAAEAGQVAPPVQEAAPPVQEPITLSEEPAQEAQAQSDPPAGNLVI